MVYHISDIGIGIGYPILDYTGYWYWIRFSHLYNPDLNYRPISALGTAKDISRFINIKPGTLSGLVTIIIWPG